MSSRKTIPIRAGAGQTRTGVAASGNDDGGNRSDDRPLAADLGTIRLLMRLMKKYDLSALDVGEGTTRIRLRRGASGPSANAGGMPMMFGGLPMSSGEYPAMMQAPAASAAATAAPAEPAPPPAKPSVEIRSPMVGTFYAASGPDSPPFVTVGSAVRENTTACVIEAMKTFTDIPAGLSGTIVEVLVKNGQPVEFDQPLFRVEPA